MGDVLPSIMAKLAERKEHYRNAMTTIAHYRWCGLYDAQEHVRLREAIIAVVTGPVVDEVEE